MRSEVHDQRESAMAQSMAGCSKVLTILPAHDTVSELTRIWQQLLGVDSISPDQNYFDLGGDSSLAVNLFTQIHAAFGVKLALATLFEAPTIEELALIIRRETSGSALGWSPLVAIQPAGSRPAFFCIHGAGGNVLMYRGLSQRLGADQPFYGLQAQGLDRSCPPLTRVEDMAALYVKEIRKQQPSGPYFIGGYCMGGTIAFEVARQLQSQGESIALLALFDTTNWCKIPVPSFWGKSYFAAQRFFFHAANIALLDSAGKAKFFSEKLKVLRNRVPVWWGILVAKFGKSPVSVASESLVLGKIWKANDQAAMTYVPRSYPGVVTDFRPMKQYRIFSKPAVKWDRLAQGGQEVIVLPVYPAGMLLEPFVEHLSTALRKCMDAAISCCETH
jgi:phthiocerol/phenolphthiocerol synthesis type-I polyketide synthase E